MRAYDKALASFRTRVGLTATESYRPASVDRLPQGHGYLNEVLTKRPQDVPTPTLFVGSGGLVSNGADMLRYLLYSMGRSSLDVSQQAMLEGDVRQGTWCLGGGSVFPAYGWFTETHTVRGASYDFYTKYGAVRGFQSFIGLQGWTATDAPSTSGVFFLTNSNVLDPQAKDDQAALAARLMTLVAGASDAESSSARAASPAYR